MKSLSAQQVTEIAIGTTALSVTLAMLMISKGLATKDEVVGAVGVALEGAMRAQGAGPLTAAVVESFIKAMDGYQADALFADVGNSSLPTYRM